MVIGNMTNEMTQCDTETHIDSSYVGKMHYLIIFISQLLVLFKSLETSPRNIKIPF